MMIENHAHDFLELLKNSTCTAVLTGAGVSVASGIPDFRSSGGLFSQISQRTFELDFFYEDPLRYYRIARQYIHPLADHTPNVTHDLLARLEQSELIQSVITQNIDRLHQKAGSRHVIEFHGDVVRFHCTQCHHPADRQEVEAYLDQDRVPTCRQCSGLIRPGITFYGDPIGSDVLEGSFDLIQRVDLFVVMGSSLIVNPAAELAAMAVRHGAKLAILNLDATPYDRIAHALWNDDLVGFSETVLGLLDQTNAP